jgi:3-oxoacyl-(acyl-carrier-protein) synthase
MRHRVVVTGLGIVAPNAIGKHEFKSALELGTSGIRFFPELEKLNFSCQIGGKPNISETLKRSYLTELQLRNFNSNGILYGIIAGMDALADAGIEIAGKESEPLWELGIVFGTGTSGVEKFREAIYKVDEGKVRRLGSTTVAQTMASGVSAYLGGMVGAGNCVTSNSSACATGTEAVLLGFERIANGQATQMLCGSCSDDGPYVWGGFDALKVTSYKYNDNPTQASRPMSQSASGFVPSSGAGALVLESLESALQRNATIYAEILGGSVNSGGQRQEGSMTAPNSYAVQKCIKAALAQANCTSADIDYINGHLTATAKDSLEIDNWCKALKRCESNFPFINSLKGSIGHGLAASGSMECVAAVLQLYNNFVAPNVNCDDVHPAIAQKIDLAKIPRKVRHTPLKTVIKASFGFGDVNACIIFRKN